MAQIQIEIHGDASLAKRDFETPPSLMDRLGSVTWNSYRTTGAPTGSQQKDLNIAKEEFAKIRTQVKTISDKVDAIQETVTKAGAPFQGDELPE